jgi:secreted trypsin-like serine protease
MSDLVLRFFAPRLAVVAVLVVAIGCGAVETTASTADPILRGRPAQDADGLARLYASGKPVCSGTVVADDWILTAAHCVDGRSASELRARIGETDLSVAASSERAVAEAIPHDTWDRGRLADDVALLRLVPSAAPPPKKMMLAECADGALLGVGRPVSLAGWGATDASHERESQSDVLNEATADLLDCERFDGYRGLDPTRVVCVGDPDGARHSCGGDSGGPLFASVPGGPPRQIGIDSWGLRPCGAPGQPSVFARVDRYLDWIHRTTSGAAGRTCSTE